MANLRIIHSGIYKICLRNKKIYNTANENVNFP